MVGRDTTVNSISITIAKGKRSDRSLRWDLKCQLSSVHVEVLLWTLEFEMSIQVQVNLVTLTFIWYVGGNKGRRNVKLTEHLWTEKFFWSSSNLRGLHEKKIGIHCRGQCEREGCFELNDKAGLRLKEEDDSGGQCISWSFFRQLNIQG